MRQALVAVVALCVAACTRGGGPYIGYGSRTGLFYGGEASVGLALAHATVGMQSRDLYKYVRFDIYGNMATYETTWGGGGRIGAGYGFGDSKEGGTFAIGGNGGYRFAGRNSCSVGTHAVIAGLELRYAAGETQLVALSRYDGISGGCSIGD
jgi:hypothetical protein